MDKFVLFLSVLLLSSCTVALYVQKGNTGSEIHVENPVSSSIDSTHIILNNPLKK